MVVVSLPAQAGRVACQLEVDIWILSYNLPVHWNEDWEAWKTPLAAQGCNEIASREMLLRAELSAVVRPCHGADTASAHRPCEAT